MRFSKYLKDKVVVMSLGIVAYIVILLMLYAFKVEKSCINAIQVVMITYATISLAWGYYRKKDFYNEISENIKRLDKAYLILETLEEPSFYEGELLFRYLYEIDKSMAENVKELELQVSDFKEYIEMWIHEVKLPLSTLTLMVHNNKSQFEKKTIMQLNRINDYIEQVLYYSRSENAEKDYIISEIDLSKVVKNVAIKNKDSFLENNIDLIIENTKQLVYTDAKWLEFILNQIISNSIKYNDSDKEDNSYIKIAIIENEGNISLIVDDNGIGIPESDLKRVFDKTFTGSNGRNKSKSTGMGLFIAKNLCEKLGHRISIESELGAFTKVTIDFGINELYKI